MPLDCPKHTDTHQASLNESTYSYSTGKCSCIPLMNMIERMVEENGGRYLKWRKYEALATRQQKTHEQTTLNKSEQTVVKKAQDHKEICKYSVIHLNLRFFCFLLFLL